MAFLHNQFTPGGLKVYDKKLPALLSADASFQLWLEMQISGADVLSIQNKLCEGNMRIAAAIASRYSMFLPWLKEDVLCEALLGLTCAVNNFKNCVFKEPGSLRGYLRKSIHGAVGEFISINMSGLQISGTQYSRIKKGLDRKFKTPADLPKVGSLDLAIEQKEILPRELTPEEGREHLIDRMQRLMKDAGLDEAEYQVMLFYLAGYTNEETAAALSISTGKVQYKKTEAAEKIKYIFFDSIVDLESYSSFSDSIKV